MKRMQIYLTDLELIKIDSLINKNGGGTMSDIVRRALDEYLEKEIDDTIINNQVLLKDEIWKDIAEYEGKYQISNLGRVKSLDRMVKTIKNEFLVKGRILSPKITKSGHRNVALSISCHSKHFSVHKLVALTFIPNPNNYDTIHHKNNIPNDNRVENLEWCSCQKNQFYRWKKRDNENKVPVTDTKYLNRNRAHTKKTTDETVKEIRSLYITGNYTQRDLSEKFNLEEKYIHSLLTGKTHKHIPFS